MSSIFTKIINKEIPAYIIQEDDSFIAILDIMPMVKGHVLIIPKIEENKLFDNSDEILSKALLFAKPIAKVLEAIFPCNRCGISVIGLEVPHTHIHLVPILTADDLNFTRPKLKITEVEMKQIHSSILAALHSD
jgi:histidine triad (HIT) family protein